MPLGKATLREKVLSELVWKKPVVCIFKERDDPEIDPFVVVKARKIVLNRVDGGGVAGSLEDFFTLMGDADYLSSSEGAVDRYVMCWFDDTEPDMTRDLRRLRGVRLTGKVTCAFNDVGQTEVNWL